MTSGSDAGLDAILKLLGNFGKYQSFVLFLVCLAVIFHSSVHNAFVFTAMDTDYRCAIPGCDDEVTAFEPSWIKNAVPYENKKPSRCDMFILNRTAVNATCGADMFNTGGTQRCEHFVFKSEEISIVRDYKLLCNENLWKITLVGTINNIGQFFGLFISGFLSDRYGRRFILVWGMVLCSFCGIIRTFMPTYELFLLFEFLDAAFGAGSYICGFVIAVEFVGPRSRVLSGTFISACYALGEILTAAAAWLTKSWKPTIYALYGPPILLISYLWLIPESVRWCLSKGRIEEAKQTLKKAAKINNKEIPENLLEKLTVVDHDQTEKDRSPISGIFKSKTLLLRLINCCFCWVTCGFLFYGLTLNSVALAGNSYMDFILSALVEIPAYFLCIYVVDKFGRKLTLCVSFMLTGVACLGFLIAPEESEWGLCVYLFGKFGATAAFTIVYIATSEMFPTPLRHSLMGICSTSGRIGSMIAPQTPILAQIWTPLPLVMFTSMSVIAGLLTLYFPETLNVKLPDTIEEAENIGSIIVNVTKTEKPVA